MEKNTGGSGVRFLFGIALLLLAGGMLRAGDFDGTWIMNANGWTFKLKLEEKDGAVTGTMTGINNDQKSTIEGTITGNKIAFTRDKDQEYHGYLFVDDPTDKANKQTMAGTFKSGDNHAGWCAKR